jgi:hypothetical protein
MASRGFEATEVQGIEVHWKLCEVDNCASFVCIGLSRHLCYQHCGGTQEMLAISQQTHMFFDGSKAAH